MVDPEELLADTPDWSHRRADDRLAPVQPVVHDLQRNSVILLMVLVCVLEAIVFFKFFREADHPVGVHVEATPAREVSRVPRVAVQVKEVQAYAPAAKKKLKLPQEVQGNPDRHVVAATRTQADERPHTVITVLDAKTGTFTTYDPADPLPWVAVNATSEAGVFYGYRNGAPALRVEARQELLQVKSLHLGAIASADASAGNVDGFVGIGVWARW